jgi:diguanylate cyclase (GGDEF)-like protein/PAS domain S-box-containing protein
MSPTIVQSLREKVSLDSAPDGVMWVDTNGQILLANPAMETLTGYSTDELVGQNVTIFLSTHLHDKHAESMRGYFHAPRARAMGGMDMTLLRRDGKLLPVGISLGHWVDEGAQFAIAYIRDVTERKVYEETLRRKATHDELTGLPNRWLFGLQLNQALAQAKRSGRHVAVMFLDLDGFKAVNDSFGHSVGDELLIMVSQRLRAAVREIDTLARLGGDEFAILLSDLESTDEAVNVAKKLLFLLDQPHRFEQRKQQLHISGSIGLAFYPDDAQGSENLLRFADLAMYQAKRAGRGTYACYSSELDQRAQESIHIYLLLKDAITRNKLKLFYQPQVDVHSGDIVGAEALLRWNDDALGEISPAAFIPVAESSGLILPLSAWVLETACKQIAAWEAAGTPLRVAVNFSAQQFHGRNLIEDVGAALQRTGAKARLLEIELTESVAMAEPLLASEQIKALVDLGCGVALDDFGTGYSSLGYLKNLRVSTLKIDREFVKNLPHDLGDGKISRSVIALAHSFDLTVVAEGVETEEQLEFLRACGCQTYQGWLFAKAMEPSELSVLLTAQVAANPGV